MRIKLTNIIGVSLILLIIVLSTTSSVQAISDNNTTGGGQTTSLDSNNVSTTGGMQVDAAGVPAQYNYRDDTDTYIIEHEGHDRQVLVYAPSSVREGQCTVPVVFMLHGSSGTGLEFWNKTGWKRKAREEGFIVIFPTSQEYWICEETDAGVIQKKTTKWGTATLGSKLCRDSSGGQQIVADDHAFIRRVVALVKDVYPADARRFYVTGFSNGGAFATELATDESDIFAAAACNGIIVGIPEPPPYPIAFYVGIGDIDSKGNPFLPEGERLPVGKEALSIKYIAAKTGCTLTSLELSNTYESIIEPNSFTAKYTQDASGEPSTDRAFVFQIFKDLAHQYPHGPYGVYKYPLDMADLLYEFFSPYTK